MFSAYKPEKYIFSYDLIIIKKYTFNIYIIFSYYDESESFEKNNFFAIIDEFGSFSEQCRGLVSRFKLPVSLNVKLYNM